MAKINVQFGQLRGKIGGVVYRHDPDGVTVASEYNPHPANPRTLRQTDQRTKMNFAGLMSKVTPATCIVGLSTSGRKARSKFVSNLLRNCGNVRPGTEPGTRRVTMAYEKVVLSEGELIPLSGTVALNDSTNELTVTIERPGVGSTLVGMQVVMYAANDTGYMLCTEKAVTVAAGSDPIVVSQVFPMECTIFTAYAIPVVERASGVAVQWAQYVTDANGNYQIDTMRNLAASQALGQSQYIGVARVV